MHSQINYGGVLQTYALQQFLIKEGFDVEVIDYWLSKNNNALTGGIIGQGLRKRQTVWWLAKKIFSNATGLSEIIRRTETYDFIHSSLKLSNHVYAKSAELKSFHYQYEFIVVGSDQVWNYNWFGTPNVFLLSETAAVKKVAYAASFGVKAIPEHRVEEYKTALEKFSYISVREDEGAAIVEKLNLPRPPVVLDPTLLLDSDDWKEILDQKNNDENYYMCYWLGDFSKIYKLLVRLAHEKQTVIKIFGDPSLLRKSYGAVVCCLVRLWLMMHPRMKCCFDAGPKDFLKSFYNSSGVVSDSFHALMFSSIFRKPVKIYINSNFSRKGMSSRITDFAEKYGLTNVVAFEIDGTPIQFEESPYEDFEKSILIDREFSKKVLFQMLEVGDD